MCHHSERGVRVADLCGGDVKRDHTPARVEIFALNQSQHASGFRRSSVIFIALALTCAFCAGGCGLSESSLLEHSATIAPMSLVIDTVPSGAEARIRGGASCYTPCELTVSPIGPFTVELSLSNYQSQSVEVVLVPANPRDLSAGVRLDPNPLTVMLSATGPSSKPASRSNPMAKASPSKRTWPESIGTVWPDPPSFSSAR
jgi:hypothetical protein